MNFAKDKQNRGFVTECDEIGYLLMSNDELLDMLKSCVAVERTVAARVLGYRGYEFGEYLLTALETEQKLYPRIEMCNSIANFGAYSVTGLVKRLGKIGNNQHHKPTEEPFRKNSYPLPRDIAARTLIRIGPKALPVLFDVLNEYDPSKMSEAIDAIGFICFSGGQNKYLKPLMNCYNIYKCNDLLRWKIIRAMCAFPACMTFLEKQYQIENNPAIKQEIERSIRMIVRKEISNSQFNYL